MTMLAEIRSLLINAAAPQQEWPSMVRHRRIVVCVVLVIGAGLLGVSLTRTPGDTTFYWLTLALAVAWALGAFVSGPLHLGCIRWRGRNQRPVLTGIAIGLLVGGAFVLGGLVAREIGPVAERITRVLEYVNHGSLVLVLAITLVNGLAEELFFRGALYTALGSFHPVVISTLLYTVATCASGNPMLGFAAIILGTVCAVERRATGGVLAPVLTHVVWALIMVLALPPMFGV
ncbi:CPBP family intramembrane glutamic endopeptidase [Mycolicibacterium sphagni]|uniref:CPBP family intramembrane metalloprotease n=1 Tax=Mycolicibacterium sphagni TaxID=1786 RepID=A0A255DNL5_9MYCO|nr:type II CAAX endopeptidase family protein [Mycolicibacterium sphagni]OYN80271.1 CPBP family intramembrane metalloprotease [Mycolicibacterium sphagni]